MRDESTEQVGAKPAQDPRTVISAASVVARVAAENPRDEARCRELILEDAKRLGEEAVYAIKRGRDLVTGPSIKLARMMAGRWCNINYGYIIVGDTYDPDWRHIQGWAWDAQTNTTVSSDDRFERVTR